MNRVVLIMTALIATSSVGGARRAISFEGCGDRNGGQIKGIARDEAGKSVSGQVLELDRYACSIVTVSDGTFLFLSVPPGEHTIRASGWNYRKGPVVRVTVTAGAVSHTNFRLSPANDVLDCIEAPACAEFLKPDSVAIASLSDGERMREASIRTAYALTHSFEGSVAGAVACISDSSIVVNRALISRLPNGFPYSECGMSESRFFTEAHLIHEPSGKSAVAYYGGRIKVIDANTFESDPSYYMNPLGGASWECRFVRDGKMWTPTFCRITVIS